MKIFRLNLTKQRLAAMPGPDRALLLLLGHASNEIMVFQKMPMLSRTAHSQLHLVNLVDSAQAFIFLRVLIGKLDEAWELFRKRVLKDNSMSQCYLPAAHTVDGKALEHLKRHFGNRSPLSRIRNKIAFHYSDDDNLINSTFDALSEDHPWEFFLSDTVGNSFYYASELVVTATSMSIVADKPNETTDYSQENLGRVIEMTLDVSKSIIQLFGFVITEIVEKHAPDTVGDEIDIGHVDKASESSIPFFLDEEDLLAEK